MFLIFRSVRKNFVEKLKIVEKQLYKLNCFYGKVSHTLKSFSRIYFVGYAENPTHAEKESVKFTKSTDLDMIF